MNWELSMWEEAFNRSNKFGKKGKDKPSAQNQRKIKVNVNISSQQCNRKQTLSANAVYTEGYHDRNMNLID